MTKTIYNDKEIHLCSDDWIEIYYALDAKIDQLQARRGTVIRNEDWIAHLKKIQVTIDKAQRPRVVKTKTRVKAECKSCNGVGWVDGHPDPCDQCEGRGWTPTP